MKLIEKLKQISNAKKMVFILSVISFIIATVSFINSLSNNTIIMSFGIFIIVWFFAYIILALCALLKLAIYKCFKLLLN